MLGINSTESLVSTLLEFTSFSTTGDKSDLNGFSPLSLSPHFLGVDVLLFLESGDITLGTTPMLTFFFPCVP